MQGIWLRLQILRKQINMMAIIRIIHADYCPWHPPHLHLRVQHEIEINFFCWLIEICKPRLMLHQRTQTLRKRRQQHLSSNWHPPGEVTRLAGAAAGQVVFVASFPKLVHVEAIIHETLKEHEPFV